MFYDKESFKNAFPVSICNVGYFLLKLSFDCHSSNIVDHFIANLYGPPKQLRPQKLSPFPTCVWPSL